MRDCLEAKCFSMSPEELLLLNSEFELPSHFDIYRIMPDSKKEILLKQGKNLNSKGLKKAIKNSRNTDVKICDENNGEIAKLSVTIGAKSKDYLRKKLEKTYGQFIQRLETFSTTRNLKSDDISLFNDCISHLKNIFSDLSVMKYFLDVQKNPSSYKFNQEFNEVSHGLNVGFYSMYLAQKLKLGDTKAVEVGLAGLFHSFGSDQYDLEKIEDIEKHQADLLAKLAQTNLPEGSLYAIKNIHKQYSKSKPTTGQVLQVVDVTDHLLHGGAIKIGEIFEKVYRRNLKKAGIYLLERVNKTSINLRERLENNSPVHDRLFNEAIVNSYLSSLGQADIVGKYGKIKEFLCQCKYQILSPALTSISCGNKGIVTFKEGDYCTGDQQGNSNKMIEGKMQSLDYKCESGNAELAKVHAQYKD